MKIYQVAMERLRQAPMSGEGTANIFEVMAHQLEEQGACSGEFKLNWASGEIPDDVLIPEIILRLRTNE